MSCRLILIYINLMLFSNSVFSDFKFDLSKIDKETYHFFYTDEYPILVFRAKDTELNAQKYKESNHTEYVNLILERSEGLGYNKTISILDGRYIDKLPTRSLTKEWRVFVGLSPVNGCELFINQQLMIEDPCSLISFDKSGRSLHSDRPGLKLFIPNYSIRNNTLIISEAQEQSSKAMFASWLEALDPFPYKKLRYLVSLKMTSKAISFLKQKPELIKEKGRINRIFYYAVIVGQQEIIDYFLNQGIDINEVNMKGETALTLAIRFNNEILANYLIDRGAKKTIICSKEGQCTKDPNILSKKNGLNLK